MAEQIWGSFSLLYLKYSCDISLYGYVLVKEIAVNLVI